jgi:hemolysin activation/secretion protein
MVRPVIRAAALALSLAAATSASAQPASTGPRLDPAQLERDFESSRRERDRTERSNVRVPTLDLPMAPGNTKPLFKLVSVVVEGAKIFSSEQIAEIYRPYIGKNVSEADLAEIARLISERYRDAGFHLSRAIIPPQEVKGGLIRIRVIEGSISEVVLSGQYVAHARELLQTVTEENPSRLKTLERQLLLVNDIPGNRIRDTALDEIGVASGRFRLIVNIESWRAYSAIGLNNGGVSAIGPLQSQFSTALNSYVKPGDAAGFNLSTIPNTPRELTFGQIWYEVPVGLSGARFALSAAYGEIWPSDARRQSGTRTVSESFEARFTSVPLRSRKSSLWLIASAGFTNVSESESLGPIYNDRIRSVAITANYQLQDNTGAWNYLTLAFRQGIDLFDASENGEAFLSRSDGSATFSKFEFAFARIHKLSENWSLRLATMGQWAYSALLASQEFYLGGLSIGRGYSSGELSGDSGIAGSLEVRFDQMLQSETLKGFQLYGFLDGGTVRDFRGGGDSVTSLASAGGGIRLNFANDFDADFGVAVPLTYRSPTNLDRNPRAYFLLSKAFKYCPDQFQMRCS